MILLWELPFQSRPANAVVKGRQDASAELLGEMAPKAFTRGRAGSIGSDAMNAPSWPE